jgi:membrane glycosyltransferase
MFAILMFLGSPAWMGLLLIGTIAVASGGSAEKFIRADAGVAVFLLVLIMWFAPNLATAIDVLFRPAARRAFGGGLRFAASVVAQMIFVILVAPIMWFGHTVFLTGLLLGRTVGWGTQARDDHEVPLALAVRQFWPQAWLGVWTVAVLALTVPGAIVYALFIAGGPLLSIPLAVWTSSPAAGRALVRIGLGRLPEEAAPPAELLALALPAIEEARVADRVA